MRMSALGVDGGKGFSSLMSRGLLGPISGLQDQGNYLYYLDYIRVL